MHFFMFLCLDGHQLFYAIAVQSFTLDRHIVFPGGNGTDCDTICAVGGKHLIDDASTGAIVLVKNDQYGILGRRTGVAELEANRTGIDDPCFQGRLSAGRQPTPSRLRSCYEEQTEEGKGKLFDPETITF